MGSSGSARSGPEGLLPRVNLANPLSYAPRPRRKGKGRGRGTEGGDANLPCPPFFLWGELFLLLLVRGEGKYEGAGAPHCAPGRTIQHTAPRAAVPKYSIVYASASRSAMHTPVDVTGVEPALYLVCKTLACRLSAHTLRFFSGWGIGDPGMDGRTPFAGLAPAVLGVHAPSRRGKSFLSSLILLFKRRSRGISLSARLRGGTLNGLGLLS